MRKLISTKDLTHAEWLEWRRKGIGGSDAASIVGVSPWRSAVQVFIDKTETIQEDIDNERMRIGRDLEDYVAKRFEEETGKKVRRNNYMLQHDDFDFLIANIDREIVGEKALLECKTTNSYAKKDWENDIPIYYQMQCLHYLLVTGYERCYIAVLIGNEAFKYYTIERDEETIQMLLDTELSFWNDFVLANACPPPDGSNRLDELLNKRYKDSVEDEIPLEDVALKYINRLDDLTTLKNDIDTQIKENRQHLKLMLEDAEKGVIADRVVTWKTQKRHELDTKRIKAEAPELYEKYGTVSSSRVFKVK